jgi:hypothetical protein
MPVGQAKRGVRACAKKRPKSQVGLSLNAIIEISRSNSTFFSNA